MITLRRFKPTCLVFFLLALASLSSTASDFYISPSGSDARKCTNPAADACASFARCAEVMSPGDTCYALDGTYNVRDTHTEYPNNGWVIQVKKMGSPTARYRFTSLSQDATRVVITRGVESSSKDTFGIIGSVTEAMPYGKHIELDHVTFEGRMWTTAHIEDIHYHHNICRCPNSGTGGGNGSCFYTRRAPDYMHGGIRIFNNRFVHDAQCPARGSSYPYVQFIVAYDSNGMIIENNDFVNTDRVRGLASFIFLKNQNKDTVVRYNYLSSESPNDGEMVWLMDCDGEAFLGQTGDRSSQGGSPSCNARVYQNVIFGGATAIKNQDGGVRKQFIYNNTVIATTGACLSGTWDSGKHCEGGNASMTCSADADCAGGRCVPSPVPSGIDQEYFNNICYATADHPMVWWESWSDTQNSCMRDQSYFDNNIYYPSHSYSGKFVDCFIAKPGDAFFTSLAAWKSHLSGVGMERNSRELDPLFVNGATRDYRLQSASPARSGGRGGAWPTVLGAYVTGVEAIGCTFAAACYSNGWVPPPPGQSPPVVGGLLRTDAR